MNINIAKFLHSTTGRYLLSIILGIGLASLFRQVCKGKNCIIFHAPPMDQIEGKIYKQDKKCYKYNTQSTKCNASKKVDFESN